MYVCMYIYIYICNILFPILWDLEDSRHPRLHGPRQERELGDQPERNRTTTTTTTTTTTNNNNNDDNNNDNNNDSLIMTT